MIILRRALERRPTATSGSDAPGAEVVGQPVRPPADLSIRQRTGLRDHRHRLRPGRRLEVEELVDAAVG